MRTLRELAGWALLLLATATPFVVLLTLAVLLDHGRLPFLVGLVTALLAATWPAMILNARRLRDPRPEEVAEADGRPPVLLLSSPARAHLPLLRRLLPGPGLARDWAEHLHERAIGRGLGACGPIVPFARPRPAPSSGPVRDLDLPADWEQALEVRLRSAGLVAVVVDGTPANARELERARTLLGLRRMVIIPPPKVDEAFLRRWSALRAELPYLPDISSRTAAIRFRPSGEAMALTAMSSSLSAKKSFVSVPRLMLLPGEASLGPAAPIWSWLLTAVPFAAAFVGSIATPLLLDLHGVDARGDDLALGALLLLALAVPMAILSRRAVALVPSNEAVMVAVAAAPWLVYELFTFLVPSSGIAGLRESAIASAYSAPMLLAAALVLAGSALIRKSPGRSPAYGVFGVAALCPFAALAMSIGDAGAGNGALVLALVMAAFALAVTAIGASGDAGRMHAPVPLGAATAAVLAVAAWGCALSGVAARQVRRSADGGLPSVDTVQAIDALSDFERTWPWFALIGPVAITLIALSFAGRMSRVSIGNLAALAPLLFLIGTVSSTRARVHEGFAQANGGARGLEAAAGSAIRSDFALPVVDAAYSPGPIDLVVDAGGVIARGERVAAASDLLGSGGWGGPGLSRELARWSRETANRRPLRVAADAHVPASLVEAVLRCALMDRAAAAQLVVERENGTPGAIDFERPGQQRWESGTLHLIVEASQLRMVGSDGTLRDIPDVGRYPDLTPGPDLASVSERLAERHVQEPSRRQISLLAGPGTSTERLATVAATARRHFGLTPISPGLR